MGGVSDRVLSVEPRMSAQARLACAYGIAPDGAGSGCAFCGASPFAAAGPRARILGPNFSGHELLWPHADVCVGCQRLLAGRPGSTPPPLRTITVYLSPAGDLSTIEAPDVGALLLDPPSGEWVLSWSENRKKHHFRWAGVSTRDRIVCGHDDGPIVYCPREDAEIVAAARSLRTRWSRRAVALGLYDEPRIVAYGPMRWARDEATIRPARASRLLALLTWALPPADLTEADDMIPDADTAAADLLAQIARASRRRRADGRQFWGGYFRHRVERFARLPLAGLVSRLMDDCEVQEAESGPIVETLAALPADRTSAIEEAIRARGGLITALAFRATRSPHLEASL
jgi:hypothetical protein